MFRQQHPRSVDRHIPTSYDGRELGRDDPVWQAYVQEAKKWDDELVDGWNGFVIESYKSLQQDNAEITAQGIAQMTDILRAMAAGEPLSPRNSTIIPSNFQPTYAAVIVNLSWFLSLSLSIVVTLVAMLVKQWGEGYRSGSGLTPPCTHARIRQSRFDNLKKWKTEDIVLALPAMMHAALGLFLFGLIVFLWDLNHTIAFPVIAVVALALTGYVLATILPLLVAFCPYSTPVTSRILWGYLRQFFFHPLDATNRIPVPPCQRKEKEIADSNTPDHVTGQALDWLIKHSRDKTVVDVAIRAIAGAELPNMVWELLTEDSLIVLVAQKFTAFFNGALDQETTEPKLKNKELEIASLYGRALTNIVKHKRPVDAEITQQVHSNFEQNDTSDISPLTDDQMAAVTRGLDYLASYEDIPDIAAFGITSVSAWYIFTGLPRIKWKDTIVQSFKIILNHIKRDTLVRPATLASLVDTLPIEASYWNQRLSRQDKRDVLRPLIDLLSLRDKWVGQMKEHIPLVLAVLAISANDYPDFRTINEIRHWEYSYGAYQMLVATHVEAAETWGRGPTLRRNILHSQSHSANDAGWRRWRAKQAARIYTTYPSLLKEHKESLFLLGLAGLLDLFSSLGLGDRSADIASTVASNLNRITVINISQAISLPFVLPAAFDIRAYAVDQIVQKLRPARYANQQDVFDDDAKVELLAALSEKHRVWVDFGAQLALPVIELLQATNNRRLQAQCLISMEEHMLTDPFPHEWELFSHHDIPYKLVQIVQENTNELSSRAISNFNCLSQPLCDPQIRSKFKLFDILLSLFHNNLLETLVMNMVCQAPVDLIVDPIRRDTSELR
ncbi:hypothetical protein FRC07_000132 [Ceratobasidium sp. 392]|nr:hypothetical protein FRC07_000132 [Ceratobasidium sp. 392]